MNLSGTRGDLLRQFLEIDPSLEAVLWKVRLIPGSIAMWQQAALAHLAKQYNRPGAVILNIGTKYGLSTACLCLGAPKALVHTLEPSPKRVAIAKKRLKRYNAQVHTIKSVAFLEMNLNLALDMVFVDGCHKHIDKDLPWFNHLRAGGLFLSHDYAEWKFPYVVKALDDLRKTCGKPVLDVLLLDERKAGMAGMYKDKS